MKYLKSSIEILSENEIEMIHNAALGVLERTGFHLPESECLNRCKNAGAYVDEISGVVKLPVKIVEEMISVMKKETPDSAVNTPKLCGGISTQVFVTDYTTKTRRYGNTDDVMKGIALVKHLKNIPSCNSVTIPSDVPASVTDLHSYKLLMQYSQKPGGTYILSKETGDVIMDMSEAVGTKAFYLFESVSPLRFRKETLDMGLRFADRGHYLGIAPMIMGGMSAPITLAGTVTLIVAEVLASIFAVNAITGEKGGFFGHGSHTNDPRSMLCSFGSPNQALIAVATAQMAKFYGVGSGSNTALSDSLMPDFQCGFEKTFSALMGALSGSVSIGCQGIAGADQGFSFEQLVLDNEWLDAYNYVISGFEVNEETIAQELINTVGIGGNFIAEEHTGEYLRESWWHSDIFKRDSFDNWVTDGGKDSLVRAHEKVLLYTKDYKEQKPVISQDKFDMLEKIVKDGMKKILDK